MLTALVIAATLVVAAARLARAYPAQAPKHWHAPRGWLRGAVCVHDHEGAWNDLTGNGYAGGMQFLLSTWESVGGPVAVIRGVTHWADIASPREQLYRAWLVWKRDGGSWSEWGTAAACGLY